MSETLAQKQKRAVYLTAFILFAVVFGLMATVMLQTINARPDVKAELEQRSVLLFETPRLLPEVELLDHNGDVFNIDRFKGKWNVVNFGYTYCPDICPTNMADMNMAAKQLADLGLADQLQFWMFSVDPARDTVEQLALYVPFFNPSFLGVTGTPEQLSIIARQLSAVYFQEGTGEGYTVAHSDNYAIINPQGHFVALKRPPHKPSQIVETMSLLISASR